MEKINYDMRFKDVRKVHDEAKRQMGAYWLSRYSWGQPCDPMRLEDWAALCANLKSKQVKGLPPSLDDRFVFPSGNSGTLASLIEHYHDGWELLEDLGLWDTWPEHEVMI